MCEVLAYGEKQRANISRAHVGTSNGRLNGRQMYLGGRRHKGNRVETFQTSWQCVCACVSTQAHLNESHSHIKAKLHPLKPVSHFDLIQRVREI